MDWKKLLGSITASVDEELRLRNAYVHVENHILRQQITGRLQLLDGDRKALAELGQQLGKKALTEIATIAQPETILAWHRILADQKMPHTAVGRPRIGKEIEDLVVRMARENCSWGYDRIVGALAHLGYTVSDQTVGNILKRHGIPPAPERKKTVTWREFIRFHMAILGATDFFTSEMWRWFGLTISSLCCSLYLARQQVHCMGMLLYQWTQKMGSCVLHALNVRAQIKRWSCWMKTFARSWAIRCGAGVSWHKVLECTPAEAGQPHSQGIGKVAFLSAVHQRPIRDGPRQHQQQRHRMFQDNIRKAA